MKLSKKINLEGNHTVWARVYRDDIQIAFQQFDHIFTGVMFPSREARALFDNYKKANEWADGIILVEETVDHGNNA